MKQLWRWLSGALLLMAMVLPTRAAESSGSIRIHLEVGDLPVINGAFSISRVGSPISDGYRIEDFCGGGFVKKEDALSPHLAQWMSEAENKSARQRLLDADGNAVFGELTEGLYLVEQTELTDGFYPIQPFLITIPSGSRWDLQINTEPLPRATASPATGQDPAPILGLLGMLVSGMGLYLCAGGKLKRR